MLLYHYSGSHLKELLTRRQQGSLSSDQIKEAEKKAKETKQPGAYVDHISFFIEPIPYKSLPGIFLNEHHFWKKDKVIYEHIVDTDSLPVDILWSIVETPEMDKFTDRFDWVTATSEERQDYIIQMHVEMEKKGFTGRGVGKLESKIHQYLGKTEKFYKSARERSDADDTKNQYAACVPHLMVYPSDGVIQIQSVNKVVLGKGVVTPAVESAVKAPLWSKW